MTTYNRGVPPDNPQGLVGFLRKELEKIQRAFASISTAWADITGKPTTIAGFGITDAYTKTQVDAIALQNRQDLTITTASLANLATENGTFVMPFHTMRCVLMQLDRAGWVRMYGSAAAQAADAGRGFTTVGTAGTGLLADIRFTGAGTVLISPNASLSNQEVPKQLRVFYTIQNRSGGASPMLATLTVCASEL